MSDWIHISGALIFCDVGMSLGMKSEKDAVKDIINILGGVKLYWFDKPSEYRKESFEEWCLENKL